MKHELDMQVFYRILKIPYLCEIRILQKDMLRALKHHTMIHLRILITCKVGKMATNHLPSQWLAPSF